MLVNQWLSVVSVATTVVSATGISSFPALFFSEQLVPGLKLKFHDSDNVYTKKELINQLHYSIDDCSADAYFLVNQPGLKLEDFQHFTNFGYLRAYMGRASSILSLPHVLTNDGDLLDMDKLNDYVELHCQLQTYRVVTDQSSEVPHYIDIKKRVIRINFSELPEDEEERAIMLQEHDNTLREILQRLPSPHHFVLFTTDTMSDFNYSTSKKVNVYEEYPEQLQSLDQLTPSEKTKLFENSIFPDITVFDQSRTVEFERNGNVKQAEQRALFPKPRLTNDQLPERDFGKFWRDINERPSLWDKDLIVENEIVILGIVSILLIFLLYNISKLMLFGLKVAFGGKTKKKSE